MHEQPQALASCQLMLVTVLRDVQSLDQVHDEVRSAAAGLPSIKHLGDVRVVHDRQRLPLRLEAGDDLAAVHARLEDLEGDLATDRLALLGSEDQAAAP